MKLPNKNIIFYFIIPFLILVGIITFVFIPSLVSYKKQIIKLKEIPKIPDITNNLEGLQNITNQLAGIQKSLGDINHVIGCVGFTMIFVLFIKMFIDIGR